MVGGFDCSTVQLEYGGLACSTVLEGGGLGSSTVLEGGLGCSTVLKEDGGGLGSSTMLEEAGLGSSTVLEADGLNSTAVKEQDRGLGCCSLLGGGDLDICSEFSIVGRSRSFGSGSNFQPANFLNFSPSFPASVIFLFSSFTGWKADP